MAAASPIATTSSGDSNRSQPDRPSRLAHQPLTQVPSYPQGPQGTEGLLCPPARPCGHHGRQGRLEDEIRHRSGQRRAPEQSVAGHLLGLSVHPEHVIGMAAAERDHHARDPRCQLSGRDGGQQLRPILNLQCALPGSCSPAKSTQLRLRSLAPGRCRDPAKPW